MVSIGVAIPCRTRSPQHLPASARVATAVMPSPPLVVIVVGPTGSGKSRLAIDLAEALGGEVVNADALQMHEQLPICTARVREEEMRGVRHHLVGCVKYGEYFDVRSFRERAGTIVRECIANGRSVVVVGGTNYYTQALVSDSLLDVSGTNDANDEETNFDVDCDASSVGRRPAKNVMRCEADSTAYERLTKVDPDCDNRLHPNDTRRVRRYLEIYDTTGRLPSETFRQKRTMRKFESQFDLLGCKTVFVALKTAPEVLDRVIRQRVEKMIEYGLVDELETFAQNFGVDSAENSRGDVRQAIGYAEWKSYLRARVAEGPGGISDEKLAEMRMEAIKTSIQNTSRLARHQQTRLRTFATRYQWPIHFVDVTQALTAYAEKSDSFVTLWHDSVFESARNICAGAANGSTGSEHRTTDESPLDRTWIVRKCECCDKTLRGENEWNAHVEGRRHRRALASARKRQRGEMGNKHPSFAENSA